MYIKYFTLFTTEELYESGYVHLYRDYIVTKNIGLVEFVLTGLYLMGDEDARAVGNMALLKASLQYDVNKGHKFSTYATVSIKNNIYKYLKLKRDPFNCVCLSSALTTCADITYGDILADTIDIEHTYATSDYIRYILKVTWKIINKSEGVRRLILSDWIVSNCQLTHVELAETYNVSQPYVTKIINKLRQELKGKVKYVK